MVPTEETLMMLLMTWRPCWWRVWASRIRNPYIAISSWVRFIFTMENPNVMEVNVGELEDVQFRVVTWNVRGASTSAKLFKKS